MVMLPGPLVMLMPVPAARVWAWGGFAVDPIMTWPFVSGPTPPRLPEPELYWMELLAPPTLMQAIKALKLAISLVASGGCPLASVYGKTHCAGAEASAPKAVKTGARIIRQAWASRMARNLLLSKLSSVSMRGGYRASARYSADSRRR